MAKHSIPTNFTLAVIFRYEKAKPKTAFSSLSFSGTVKLANNENARKWFSRSEDGDGMWGGEREREGESGAALPSSTPTPNVTC